VTAADAPVTAAYLAEVARVAHVRHASRWFNAASVDATAAQVDALQALPFVERLDLVARFRRQPEPADAPVDGRLRASRARRRPRSTTACRSASSPRSACPTCTARATTARAS
jgi:hypothetical protein